MQKFFYGLFFLTISTPVISASFPHTSAIYQTKMSGPMMEVVTDAYVFFDGDEDKAISAEWVRQKSPVGNTHKLNITKKGIIYAIDLDRKHCTKTNIQSVTDSISDPEAFSKSMKEQMGLKEGGPCEGAGLKGKKLSSSFSEMCMYKNFFMVWMNAMGTKTEVTKVKFDVDLPKDKISVPAGIKCVEGPDISQGWPGMPTSAGTSSMNDGASGGNVYKKNRSSEQTNKQSPEDMEKAMKQAQEALKSFGDMFK